MYETLLVALGEHGMTAAHVVVERIFLSDVASQGPLLPAVRRAVCGAAAPDAVPATTRVQQPPAHPGQTCELQAMAMAMAMAPAPAGGSGGLAAGQALSELPAGASGRLLQAEGVRQVFLAGLTGGTPGDGMDVAAQVTAMFRAAESALLSAGMSFHDAARAWVYLADIERDYGALNTARRAFYRDRGIAPPPASTGISGVPFPPDRACGLDLRAVTGGGRRLTALRSGTMNEAPSYGADFSRGTRVDLPDRSILYISGTASIDTDGRVVAVGDIEGQIERTLLNVEAMLRGEGAGYAQAVSAVTYLKESRFAPAFQRIASRHGMPESLPNALCVADICRPEWLCEVEVTAVLPRTP